MNALLIIVLSLYILLPAFNLYMSMKYRSSRTQMLVVLYIVVSLLHNTMFFLEMTAQGIGEAFTAVLLEFLFGNLSLYVFAYFVFEWCQAKLPKSFHIAFALFNVALALVTLTNGYHGLLFTVDGLEKSSSLLNYTMPIMNYGPFEYVLIIYCTILYSVIGAVIAKAYLRAKDKKSRRTLILFAIAGFLPVVTESLYVTDTVTFIDPTPTGYFISQCLLLWCIMREKVFDVLQNAFELIAKRLDSALIVVDEQEMLLYFNDAANDLLPQLHHDDEKPRIVAELFHNDAQHSELQLGDGVYQNQITVLQDGQEVRGKVALLSDISYLYRLKALLEEENRRITSDLEMAATIQLSALPRKFPPWPGRTDFDIYATMHPAKEVGGDFYDFFLVEDMLLGCVVADVSGKGVPAALFMMNAKACIRDQMMAGALPDAALAAANDQLCANNDAEMFVTVWAIRINLRTGEACYANAGHNPPLKRDAQGNWSFIKSRPNLVLADTPGIQYRLNTLELDVGDALFLYTDGVTEAQDEQSRLYGNDRLLNTLMLPENAMLEPQALLRAVREDVDAFVGNAPQFDDITMLSVRIDDLTRSLTVPATLASCDTVETFVRTWLDAHTCSKTARRMILTAQDEMFSNIIRYAYPDGPEDGEATIELFTEGRVAVLRLIDAGVPFNPLDVTRQKRTYDDDWDEGGDGIYLVRKMMDDVAYEYRDGKNRFTMKKALDA